MRTASHLAAATLTLMMGISLSVSAEVRDERTTLGFDLGGTQIDAGTFDSGATRFNLRLSRELGRALEVEFSLYGARAEEDPLPGIARRVDHLVFSANVVYNFHPRETVSPYLLFGFGLGRVGFEAVGLSTSETATAIQGAAGCRWDLGKSRRSGIRLELSLASLQQLTWTMDDSDWDVRSSSLSVGFVYALRRAAPGG